MSSPRQRLIDHDSVHEALGDLCGRMTDGVAPACHAVDAQDLPAPYDWLLAHTEHMTTRLGEYHGQPVELRVLEHHLDGDLYRRKIILTPRGNSFVVELGVVSIDLSLMPDSVRDEILARTTPLGDILIAQRVHRRIDPRWFVRVPFDDPLLKGLGWSEGGSVYGRVGTIYCDDFSAIELLEIVTAQKAAV